jgi:diguanylate cyclase (GGDEF)-like protein/PAS domain S-box-containing protein
MHTIVYSLTSIQNGEASLGRLHVLHLEDSATDAELIATLLANEGLDCDLRRVQTRAEFEAELDVPDLDLIISDYTLPGFDGLSALQLARVRRPDIPFLFVSGTIGEERAVESLKGGASDFVIKDSFARLAPAVRRALEEARERARRVEAEEALRRSEERYAFVIRAVNDGLWDWELQADRVYYSQRWKAMLGCSDAEIGDRPREWFERVHPEDLPGLQARLEAHLDGRHEHFECEYRIAHRDGTHRWMLSRGQAVRDAGGRAIRLAGSQTDVTQRKLAEAQLQHAALHDALTGLPNRASFFDRLGMQMGQSKRRPNSQFCVLFLDLDRFKVVNDSLGHVMGDKLLVSIARRLETCIRSCDTVARFGGDEFAILLDDIGDVASATRSAERIHAELATPFVVEGHEVFSSASIGIALSETGYHRPEDMLRDADTAMYRAKALGQARHVTFDQAMHERAVELLRLETDLRRAVGRDEFFLQYQPVIALAGGRTAGFEALLRWRHPERGLVMPGEFIALAEETGLIVPIGRFALREAAREMLAAIPPGIGAPRLTVNLSARQLAQSDLVPEVREALAEAGVDGSQLGVEITESALIESGDAVLGRLRDLRALGARLLLDDFGTGYSSLSYLHRFPFDMLKIDASFVRDLETDPKKIELVRSILAIGHGLQMQVIAEGVETAGQLELLRGLGCDYGQGYYWSRPVEAAAARTLLSSR